LRIVEAPPQARQAAISVGDAPGVGKRGRRVEWSAPGCGSTACRAGCGLNILCVDNLPMIIMINIQVLEDTAAGG
jgi:hypothetical protein